MRIRYSEIFYSFQGEAELAGTPSVWFRFFGCNLNCNGFGQKNPTDPSTYELPFQTFDVDSVKSVNDLPVWKFGCDSSYSWSQRFKHLAHDANPAEIADRLIAANTSEHNPEGLFIHPKTNQPIMLCFTGGEPMLQKNIVPFLVRMNQRFAKTQIESNGLIVQHIPPETTLVVSPKCSEKNGQAVKYLEPNKIMLARADCLKFSNVSWL